jgi:hypothetical protein
MPNDWGEQRTVEIALTQTKLHQDASAGTEMPPGLLPASGSLRTTPSPQNFGAPRNFGRHSIKGK